jgi:hypothetical protein
LLKQQWRAKVDVYSMIGVALKATMLQYSTAAEHKLALTNTAALTHKQLRV